MPTTAASTATTSIIASLGAGSGIDFAGLAQNLAAASFASRIDRNAARSETVDRQISAASALKSSLLQLASSIGDRVRSGDLSSQPQIANPSVATLTRGSVTGRGNYSLEVTRLAAAQVVTGPVLPSASDVVGSGNLTFRFGTVSGGVFAEDTGKSPASVTIPTGATLAETAAAINSAGIGISAYVASDTAGARLVLKGREGSSNGFIVEAAEVPGDEGLSILAWSPSAAPERLSSAARDAELKLDGVSLTRPSNSIADLVPGANVTITGTNTGSPTTISFTDPGAAVGTFMTDLVGALNELATELGKQTDPQSGDLARIDGARAMRRALAELASTIIMPGAAGGEPRTLADLGLATNRDGTFRLDTGRMSATVKAAPGGVAAMFTTGLFGVYASFDKLGRKLSSLGDPGTLAGSLSRLAVQKKNLTDEAAKLAESQEKMRVRLALQFSGTESRVTQSKSTLSFLQNQIAAWNAKGN